MIQPTSIELVTIAMLEGSFADMLWPGCALEQELAAVLQFACDEWARRRGEAPKPLTRMPPEIVESASVLLRACGEAIIDKKSRQARTEFAEWERSRSIRDREASSDGLPIYDNVATGDD